MTTHQWLVIPDAIVLFGFIFFAFRQGLKVKPDTEKNRNGTMDTPTDWSSSWHS